MQDPLPFSSLSNKKKKEQPELVLAHARGLQPFHRLRETPSTGFPVLTFVIVLPVMCSAPLSLSPTMWWGQGLTLLFLCPQRDSRYIIGSREFQCRIKKNMVCGFIKPNLFCTFYQTPVKSWKSWGLHSLVLWSIWNRRWKNVSVAPTYCFCSVEFPVLS